jgi:hypothetical protein
MIDTNPRSAISGVQDRVIERDQFLPGSLGPASGVGGIKTQVETDEKLKRSLIYAYAQEAVDGLDQAHTTIEGH